MSRRGVRVQSAVMTSISRSQQSSRRDCQVLVVGAGPTGLVLACELLARGIRARVIDKGDGVVLQTRALGIHARTLEVFDMMGLAERFVEHGQVVRRFHMYADGKTLVRLELARNGSAFGFMLDVPQDVTETILRQRVSELGGSVEQGTELSGLSQDPGGVTATVIEPGGTARTITADYVVGADGAHSRVRSELGLDFRGHPYPQDWLLADVHLDWDRPDDEMHAFFRRDGRPLICMPMREHLWRVILPYAGERDRRAPTLEEIQRLVGERAPEPVPVSDPAWLATFRCQRRSTHTYRRGRVMLAGDAVHIHSPAGGQGMNTGIMDAHNLAWKLALVASGHSPDGLLDTYGQERGPVAADVLALTHTLVKLGTMTHPVQRALRDTIVPMAGRLAPIQRRAVRRISHIQRVLPLQPADASRREPRRSPAGPAGAGPRSDRRRRKDPALRGPAPRPACAPDLSPRSRRGLADQNAALAGPGRCGRGPNGRPGQPGHDPSGSVCLLRPDVYVAARGSVARPDNVLDYLHRLCGFDQAVQVGGGNDPGGPGVAEATR